MKNMNCEVPHEQKWISCALKFIKALHVQINLMTQWNTLLLIIWFDDLSHHVYNMVVIISIAASQS